MLRYDIATASDARSAREEARRWLHEYNRGDVSAAQAVRNWLDRTGSQIPAVESLDPTERATH